MNEFLLKDFKWTEQLIEMTCDNFTSKIRRIADTEDATVIENLEDELYLWSIYCKLTQCLHLSLAHKNLLSFSIAIVNLMLGSSTSEQSDRKFDAKVWEFVTIIKRIFEATSKLMSIPIKLADKMNMKAYVDFEDAAHRSIAICMITLETNFNFISILFFVDFQHEVSFPF